MIKRNMTYNQETERWEIHMDGWFSGVHCGECLTLRVGDQWIPCRMELDRDWYVIMKETQFTLRQKKVYQVFP